MGVVLQGVRESAPRSGRWPARGTNDWCAVAHPASAPAINILPNIKQRDSRRGSSCGCARPTLPKAANALPIAAFDGDLRGSRKWWQKPRWSRRSHCGGSTNCRTRGWTRGGLCVVRAAFCVIRIGIRVSVRIGRGQCVRGRWGRQCTRNSLDWQDARYPRDGRCCGTCEPITRTRRVSGCTPPSSGSPAGGSRCCRGTGRRRCSGGSTCGRAGGAASRPPATDRAQTGSAGRARCSRQRNRRRWRQPKRTRC
jgi:hypothetical protein